MHTNLPCEHTKRPTSIHTRCFLRYFWRHTDNLLNILVRTFTFFLLTLLASEMWQHVIHPEWFQHLAFLWDMLVLFGDIKRTVITAFTNFHLYLRECVCQCVCLSRCTVVTTTCAPGSWLPSKRRQSCRRMNQACVHRTWGVPPLLTKHTKTLAPGTGPHPVYPLSCPSHTPLPAALCLLQEEEVPLISFSR